MPMTTGDLPVNITLAPLQWVRSNAANTALEPCTIPDFPASFKRTETYTGTTDGSGNYSVSYGTAFSATPDVQPQLQAGSNTQLIKITSSSASGFTVNVQNRSDVIGLLPTYAAVSGASVGVLVTSR